MDVALHRLSEESDIVEIIRQIRYVRKVLEHIPLAKSR